MKICTTCKIEKEIVEFNKNKSRKDGLNTICRKCSNERSRKYYKDNGEEHKNNVVRRNSKYKEKIREFILNYFKNNNCKDCGNNDLRVLEFDHLPEFEKSYDISTMLSSSMSLETIQKEINKCDVVCANCHRIRTYDRKTSYRNMQD